MSARARLADWWAARAPRERIMLIAMLLALAAFALWLGAWRPLRMAAEAAQERRVRATTALAEVRAEVAAIADLQRRHPPAATAEALAQTVLRTAAAERVPISRQRMDDAGMLTVGIDAVAAPALFAWLDALARQHGLAPVQLEAEERNGELAAEVGFATVPADAGVDER